MPRHPPDIGIAVKSLRPRRPNSHSPAPREAPDALAEGGPPSRRVAPLPASPFGQLLRPIGHDQIGAGPFERSHDLENGSALVEASLLHARLHHREFTAHVINRGRFAKTL